MYHNLDEIKLLRKRLDMTQHDLAKLSGVSQSMLAKIEAGLIDPSYTKACRIFEILESNIKGQRGSAKDVMNKKLVIAKPKETIANVIKDMKKYGISQLPVVDEKQVIGMISERIILEALLAGKKKIVEDVMADRPPSVSLRTGIDIVSRLLVHFPMVIVYDKVKIAGIITKADILAGI